MCSDGGGTSCNGLGVRSARLSKSEVGSSAGATEMGGSVVVCVGLCQPWSRESRESKQASTGEKKNRARPERVKITIGTTQFDYLGNYITVTRESRV
jgi:hypothetical protein